MFVMTDEVKRELEASKKFLNDYDRKQKERELKEVNKKIAELEAKDADHIKEEREKKDMADINTAFDKGLNYL